MTPPRLLLNILSPLLVAAALIAMWQLFVFVSAVEPFILPSPLQVFNAIQIHARSLFHHALFTLSEIILGLLIGLIFGITAGIFLASFSSFGRLLLPVFVISQALPVFALAPLLTLWLGFGMASKVAMAALIIFFPVTSATHDGLRFFPSHLLVLSAAMQARPLQNLLLVRIPAALPSIASGIRIAAASAPIGAIVGEWIGSAQGLGFIMLQANARVQTDLMFAALSILVLLALSLYKLVDLALRLITFWHQPLHLSLSASDFIANPTPHLNKI